MKFDFFRKPDTEQKLKKLYVFYDSYDLFPLDFNLFSQMEVLKLHYYLGRLEIGEELNLPELKTLALISIKLRRPVHVNSDHLTNLFLCDEIHRSSESPVRLKGQKRSNSFSAQCSSPSSKRSSIWSI